MTITTYGLLLAGIVCETLGSSFLEKSEGLSRVFPAVLSLCFHAAAFVLGSHVLKTMPVGIMYAVWCGVGIMLMGGIGYVINRQILDAPARSRPDRHGVDSGGHCRDLSVFEERRVLKRFPDSGFFPTLY